MPRVKLTSKDLSRITGRRTLFAFLEDRLGWPLSDEEEDLTYPISDLGSVVVRQLLPFASDDPWLILLVEFEGAFRRDEVRKTLREIRRLQRQEARYEGKGISDILFICAARDYREIQFVRFIERGSRQPKLKVFGWNPETQNQNRTVTDVCLPALALDHTADGGPDWATAKWTQAWDVEKVTKEFFKGFDELRKETVAMLQPAFGADKESANWAVSVQLNRLLFVYFLADQGFLRGGVPRLKDALARGNFHEWFQSLALDALGRPGDRPDGMEDVPYLNGGLFVLHETEQGRELHLPDAHYESWFRFLGSFRWTLSESEGVNTISPHILGYLFERYINQKQMGAYYTKEDVTGYICRSTVIPRLFDKVAEALGREAVRLDIGAMSEEGNRRYIFPSVKQRAYLPTETEYEYRRRTERLQRLEKADLQTVDDFVTHNLDLELLVEDWLATRRDPRELLAAYDALQSITILDPTVGSGAFLLAAQDILAPLYDVALRRMESMVKEAGHEAPDVNWAGELNLEEAFDQKVLADPGESQTIGEMRKRLDEVTKHANSAYFIRKRILLNNLFGVDIMPEAVEICKLRLYLALVSSAHAESVLEPLPDVDLNYRAGNALVGFVDETDVNASLNRPGELPLEWAESRILKESVARIREINALQEEGTVPHDLIEDVEEVRKVAVAQLDRRQAEMRNVPLDGSFVLTHRPFHWLAEFPTVLLASPGFDCVIGNPPYVEYHKVRSTYTSLSPIAACNDLYPLVVERASMLLARGGYLGFILPLGGFNTARTEPYRHLLISQFDRLHLSHLSGDAHPSTLFEGVKYRLSIVIGRHGSAPPVIRSSRYTRWYSEARPHLFSLLHFAATPGPTSRVPFAKTGEQLGLRTLEAFLRADDRLGKWIWPTGTGWVDYHRSPVNWIRALNFEPYFKGETKTRSDDHVKRLKARDQEHANALGAVLMSTHFFYWFVVQGNCRDLAAPEIEDFPIPGSLDSETATLSKLYEALMEDLRCKCKRRVYVYETAGAVEYDEFYVKHSKSFIDEIDRILAPHYGLTSEELNFIINYDIKFRMGREANE